MALFAILGDVSSFPVICQEGQAQKLGDIVTDARKFPQVKCAIPSDA